ncbi:hypothetical protein [Mycolicibacterium mageritense]|uniref:hypothetical protein n=1 Tax=Mycolicibacterium mageritense TaxID=53462 RepID=UPI001E6249BA|nr:hypothetical protein [Mycolicibacterium mageritense]GJJ23083.1 hypothetical protein MTY414_67560 [Mycolicibacterium mageritense]
MILRRIAIGATLVAAPLVFAAPAMATPGTVDCSAPCVNRATIAADESPTPIWNQIWPGGDAVGPWESIFASDPWGNGVQAVNGGAWEKVFGEPPE